MHTIVQNHLQNFSVCSFMHTKVYEYDNEFVPTIERMHTTYSLRNFAKNFEQWCLIISSFLHVKKSMK